MKASFTDFKLSLGITSQDRDTEYANILKGLIRELYTVYGIARDKCPSQTDYTITDNVTVHVDEQLWSTTGNEVSSCAGDWLDLKDFINIISIKF